MNEKEFAKCKKDFITFAKSVTQSIAYSMLCAQWHDNELTDEQFLSIAKTMKIAMKRNVK